MFDSFKSWFGASGDKGKTETGKIADMDLSRALLKELKEAGCQLMFRIRGYEGSYTSTIVEVEKTSFLIDTLLPDSGNSIITKAEDIYVESMLRGITCSFLTRCLGNVVHADNFPALRLELPLEISRYQRRSSYRLKTSEDTTISFLSPLDYTGPLYDISAGGVGFEYQATLGRFHVGDVISNMFITLGDYTFAAEGVVASNMISEIGTLSIPLSYRCGVKFVNLPREVEEGLQQSIIKIQRARQQKQIRVE